MPQKLAQQMFVSSAPATAANHAPNMSLGPAQLQDQLPAQLQQASQISLPLNTNQANGVQMAAQTG